MEHLLFKTVPMPSDINPTQLAYAAFRKIHDLGVVRPAPITSYNIIIDLVSTFY